MYDLKVRGYYLLAALLTSVAMLLSLLSCGHGPSRTAAGLGANSSPYGPFAYACAFAGQTISLFLRKGRVNWITESVRCFLAFASGEALVLPSVERCVLLRRDAVFSKLLKRGILLAEACVSVFLLLFAFLRSEQQTVRLLRVVPMVTYAFVQGFRDQRQ